LDFTRFSGSWRPSSRPRFHHGRATPPFDVDPIDTAVVPIRGLPFGAWFFAFRGPEVLTRDAFFSRFAEMLSLSPLWFFLTNLQFPSLNTFVVSPTAPRPTDFWDPVTSHQVFQWCSFTLSTASRVRSSTAPYISVAVAPGAREMKPLLWGKIPLLIEIRNDLALRSFICSPTLHRSQSVHALSV